MYSFKLLLPLLLFATLQAPQQPLPPEIKFEGKQKELLKWDDTEGRHLLLLTETGPHTSKKFKHETDEQDTELFATTTFTILSQKNTSGHGRYTTI